MEAKTRLPRRADPVQVRQAKNEPRLICEENQIPSPTEWRSAGHGLHSRISIKHNQKPKNTNQSRQSKGNKKQKISGRCIRNLVGEPLVGSRRRCCGRAQDPPLQSNGNQQ